MAGSWIRVGLVFSIALNSFWILYFLSTSNTVSYRTALSSWQNQAGVGVLNGRKILYSSNNETKPVPPAAGIPAIDHGGDTTSLLNSLDAQVTKKPYIFIGGVPSSGTTLTRAILDAHPDIRCGEETRVVPRILQMRERWNRSKMEHKRLIAAGLNDTVLNILVRNFVSGVIELHGPKAQYLCNKDPLSLSQINYLHEMFPNAKFILMIRDGRAVANSIVSRNVTITGVDHKNYLSAALFWNKVITRMLERCDQVGSRYCYKLYYERLVESPEEEERKLLKFLGIPWSSNGLHHSDFVNSEVSLSKFEPSSRQVQNAITRKSVDKWRRNIPLRIQEKIWLRCPMLQRLGYEE